jgi:hypothetical protein
MGLGVVLLLYAIVGMIVASVGSAVLGLLTAFFTKGAAGARRSVIIAACVFPFACLAWAGGVFVFQAVVNEGLLHRDLGLGDVSNAPLSSGYEIKFIDVTDEGLVYNQNTQSPDGIMEERNDAVDGVRLLQESGPFLLGGADTQFFQHSGQDSKKVDSYFLMDTRAGTKAVFKDREGLEKAAADLHIKLKLEPIWNLYARHRFTWFDVLAGLLLVIPPITSFVLLFLSVVLIRKGKPVWTWRPSWRKSADTALS